MAYHSIKLSKLRAQLTPMMDAAMRGDHVIIHRYGKATAALIPMEDLYRVWEDQDMENVPSMGGPLRDQRLFENHQRHEMRKAGEDARWIQFWNWVRGFVSRDVTGE